MGWCMGGFERQSGAFMKRAPGHEPGHRRKTALDEDETEATKQPARGGFLKCHGVAMERRELGPLWPPGPLG
jgi:hypothetical protein